MRFDLLDEYSTLVPFGLGNPPKRPAQHRAAAAVAAGNRPVATSDRHLELPRKFMWALRRTLSAYGRSVAEKYSWRA